MSAISASFWNVGRRRNGSSKRLDREGLEALYESTPKRRAAVFFAEVNEGDDNNELWLIRQVFKGWHVFAGSPAFPVREPILLSPDFSDRAKQHVVWIPRTAVKHWGPTRSLLRVDLLDEPTTLLGMHYPAGPFTEGDRPDWAEAPLERSWRNCHAVHRHHEHRLHDKGRNIIWMMDVNHYDFPAIGREQQIVHQRTDYGRVWAATGYEAKFRSLPPVEMPVDSHDGQRMRGRFAAVS